MPCVPTFPRQRCTCSQDAFRPAILQTNVPLSYTAVPCLRRAHELEGGYNPNSEFALQGEGEEGWVATHSDPGAKGQGSSGAGGGSGDEHIPSIDDDEGPAAGATGAAGAGAGGAGDDDIPDITELELNEADDEVG